MSTKDDLDNVYFFLLERTVRRFRQFSQRELSKRGYNISGEQWVILKRLQEHEGTTQKEIASSTYKDPASVTRMIDLLVKKGLVKREAGPDRRSLGIFLTEEGKNLVSEILPIADEMRKYGMRGVSAKDKEVFMQVLNKIYDNIE